MVLPFMIGFQVIAKNCNQLRTLCLSNCENITKQAMVLLKCCRKLTSIDLSHTKVSVSQLSNKTECIFICLDSLFVFQFYQTSKTKRLHTFTQIMYHVYAFILNRLQVDNKTFKEFIEDIGHQLVEIHLFGCQLVGSIVLAPIQVRVPTIFPYAHPLENCSCK